MGPIERNWAGNVTFGAAHLARPRTIAELQQVVVDAVSRGERVHALGARHSFSDVADTGGTLIAMDALDRVIDVIVDADRNAVSVIVEGGIRYDRLTSYLDHRGLALHNLPSLPHVSVAGAVATGTHGSGDRNRSLADAVECIELVAPDGALVPVIRGGTDAAAAWVGLGAFGVAARLTLRVEPAFEIAQRVHLDLPFEIGVSRVDEILSSAYSVSMFTDWTADRFHQIWRKHRHDESPPGDEEPLFGSALATTPVHPVPGMPSDACTEQLGRLGPWNERLPHFRATATPSAGAELQSEFFVGSADAPSALLAVRDLTDVLQPLVLVTEVRSIAGDEFWLSPAYERDSVAIHFTWRPAEAEVRAVLPMLEAALAPFAPRPHWGKLTTMPGAAIRRCYPRLDDVRRHRDRFDPTGVFRNRFLDDLLGTTAGDVH